MSLATQRLALQLSREGGTADTRDDLREAREDTAESVDDAKDDAARIADRAKDRVGEAGHKASDAIEEMIPGVSDRDGH